MLKIINSILLNLFGVWISVQSKNLPVSLNLPHEACALLILDEKGPCYKVFGQASKLETRYLVTELFTHAEKAIDKTKK